MGVRAARIGSVPTDEARRGCHVPCTAVQVARSQVAPVQEFKNRAAKLKSQRIIRSGIKTRFFLPAVLRLASRSSSAVWARAVESRESPTSQTSIQAVRTNKAIDRVNSCNRLVFNFLLKRRAERERSTLYAVTPTRYIRWVRRSRTMITCSSSRWS